MSSKKLFRIPSLVAALAVALITSACGPPSSAEPPAGGVEDPGPTEVSLAEPTEAPGTRTISGWPPTRPPEAASCAYPYTMSVLRDRPHAFDGTIVGQRAGEYSDEAMGRPVDLTFDVHQWYKGGEGDSATVHTWDFMLPDREVAGVRLLIATGENSHFMGCGFSRPWSAEEAAEWEAAFARER